ncbi:MAG: anthranilate phosphoribosyltransferase [Actinobacteria bacterium]|uniref:anthranilate phosphoribosyltransferase n=1 Tax=freshwater metagenome TaxID=449393 RepID=A0A6J7PSI2_9ZZZZ|nr:anthranilate phosphoribosyltransferase [Actinomycetota bacterium]MSX81406.1 anthranilate phosphoribosyltransferase [Actinomycetota bacterium]
MSFVWADALGPLLHREDLDPEVLSQAMETILAGDATDAQIAALAVLLRAKGETPEEIAALVGTMLRFTTPVDLDPEGADGVMVDTCGTGGDRSHTYNVSTLAALVVAGAGVKVAKHGNRAASSACGSADLLEELGVTLDLGPDGVSRCVREAGIGFFFAPRYHPALRFAAAPRRELGIPTTFNFLGPLANPARVKRQVVGVSDPAMANRIVRGLAELGAKHAMVFFGHDGLDELTTTDVATVHQYRDGEHTTFLLDPTEFGVARSTRDQLVGGDPAHNADMSRRVLAGESGAVRDIVVLNAAAALVVADLVTDIPGGLVVAAASIDSGAAATALSRLVSISNEVAAGESA